jgi:GNAT superfamily N-acetyltransferase
MGFAVHIRKAKLSDSPFIAELLDQLGYPIKKEYIYNKLQKYKHDSDEKLFVAVGNGSVLGFISIHFIPQIALPGDFARISYFCVDDKMRYNKIGSKLEAYCEKIAKERGCDRIELHCHARRKPAHRFYRNHGYIESPKYFVKML